jgi:protein involved in polysaccharide export with SLBB domain
LNKLILKSVLLTTLFFIPQIISQEFDLDKDYLDSLPDEIREDVMKEVNASKKDKEAKRSSRPSSRLTDLEVVRNWEKFLLEDSNSKQSERYGMKLFRGMQSSFMPVNEPNFDGSYILDFGDILEVHIISQKNYVEEVEVKRDGTISIENIGKISVSGLSLETASNLLKSKIEASMIGSKGFISLTSVRDIQVLITGQANFPGIYTLSGGSNLLHALNVSGGISEQGSFRDVEIKRNGKLIESIDLYEVLIYGNASYSTNLQSGDSIYIKPVLNLARTSGAFNNEALFELKDGETLNDLVNFSGGISKDYSRSSLSLSRLIENKKYDYNFAFMWIFMCVIGPFIIQYSSVIMHY